MSASFESFIKQFAEQGRLDSEGVFTVDVSARAGKLNELYASMGDHWFLCLLQAAATGLAEKVEIKVGRERLFLAWRTDRHPPALNSRESHEYLEYIKRAASILEAQNYPALTVLQWGGRVEGYCLFRIAENRGLLELPAGATEQVARECGWSSEGPYQVVVEIKLPASSWLVSHKNRIALQWRLERLLKTKACLSPVQVHLGWGVWGQGETSNGKGEMAAEYLMGPADGDVLVKEREPGECTVYLQIAERWSGPFDGHHRAMTRWDVAPQDSPFPPFACGVGTPQPVLERMTSLKWSVTGRNRHGLIPFTRRDTDDHNTSHWYIDSTLQLPATLVLKGENSPLGIHGLPCYAVLLLPKRLKGKGTLHLLRRGVLIDSQVEDLGVPGALVYASCPALQTDAAGFSVVKNDNYEHLLEFLRGRLLQLASDMIILGNKKKIDVRGLVRAVQDGLAGSSVAEGTGVE